MCFFGVYSLTEFQNLGVETCSDVIQNQDETDVDCDGIADCVDTWLYGDESNGNPYGSCSTPWDCTLAPWSECYESSQGYEQTRFVRDIKFYQGGPDVYLLKKFVHRHHLSNHVLKKNLSQYLIGLICYL